MYTDIHTPVTYTHHSHDHKSIAPPQVKPDVELAPADAAPEAMGSTHGDPNPKAAPAGVALRDVTWGVFAEERPGHAWDILGHSEHVRRDAEGSICSPKI